MAGKKNKRIPPNVRLLQNGDWEIVVSKQIGGKRTWKTEITDLRLKKDIEKRTLDLRKEFDFAENQISQAVGLIEFLDKWLAEVVRPNRAVRTFEEYVYYTQRFIKPFTKTHGNPPVADLKPLDIHNILEFVKTNAPEGNCIRVKRVLSSALSVAVLWGICENNPAKNVKLQKIESDKRKKIFTPEQMTRFLSAAENVFGGAVFVLMAFTAMRPAEATALRWSDLECKKVGSKKLYSLNVERSVVFPKGGGFIFKRPKSKSSIRKIVIGSELVKILEDHRAKQTEMIKRRKKRGQKFDNLDLIFSTRFGSPISRQNLARREFREVLKKAKLPEGYTPNSLRHSHASLLINAGENIVSVSERLGHSDASVTMRFYAHSLPDAQEKLADKFSEIVGKP